MQDLSLQYLSLLSQAQCDDYTAAREGEKKLGQTVGIVNSIEKIATATTHGYRFALIGIPETIGPAANHGKQGAQDGWDAFLSYFLNLQSNTFLSGDDILLLGHIDCDDLHTEVSPGTPLPTSHLHQLCDQLDQRVHPILHHVFNAGLIPIIIGGGHNNAYPIIKACAQVKQQALAVSNLDPHADFRALEGRHSGNPFRYAHAEGYLERYSVLGLHEQKNSADALEKLTKLDFPFFSIQQSHWRKEITFADCISQTQEYLCAAVSPTLSSTPSSTPSSTLSLPTPLPIGVELDLDVITEMPTSAITRAGVSLDDALYYVHQMAALPNVQYLHLAEGAPSRYPAGGIERTEGQTEGNAAGKRVVGQALAELVCTFIKSAHG
ncbi:MAG: formiminoglutamase [Candidatus Endobugula sp.]|jgi:formiminoglutamase